MFKLINTWPPYRRPTKQPTGGLVEEPDWKRKGMVVRQRVLEVCNNFDGVGHVPRSSSKYSENILVTRRLTELEVQERRSRMRQRIAEETGAEPANVSALDQESIEMAADNIGIFSETGRLGDWVRALIAQCAPRHGKPLVLIGGPGWGKSTTAKYIAASAAHQSDLSTDHAVVPHYLNFKLLAGAYIRTFPEAGSTAEHVRTQAARNLAEALAKAPADELISQPGSAPALHQWPDVNWWQTVLGNIEPEPRTGNRLLLVLDALDEIPVRSDETLALLNDLLALASESVGIVITCRELHFHTAYLKEFEGAEVWRLMGWRVGSPEWASFIEEYAWKNHPHDENERKRKLIEALRKARFDVFARNPFFLDLLCFSCRRGESLPDSTAGLLEQALEELIAHAFDELQVQREEKYGWLRALISATDEGSERERRKTVSQPVIRYLRQIALNCQTKRPGENKILVEEFDDWARKAGIPTDIQAAAFREFCSRARLLSIPGDREAFKQEQGVFAHNSFMALLAAQCIGALYDVGADAKREQATERGARLIAFLQDSDRVFHLGWVETLHFVPALLCKSGAEIFFEYVLFSQPDNVLRSRVAVAARSLVEMTEGQRKLLRCSETVKWFCWRVMSEYLGSACDRLGYLLEQPLVGFYLSFPDLRADLRAMFRESNLSDRTRATKLLSRIARSIASDDPLLKELVDVLSGVDWVHSLRASMLLAMVGSKAIQPLMDQFKEALSRDDWWTASVCLETLTQMSPVEFLDEQSISLYNNVDTFLSSVRAPKGRAAAGWSRLIAAACGAVGRVVDLQTQPRQDGGGREGSVELIVKLRTLMKRWSKRELGSDREHVLVRSCMAFSDVAAGVSSLTALSPAILGDLVCLMADRSPAVAAAATTAVLRYARTYSVQAVVAALTSARQPTDSQLLALICEALGSLEPSTGTSTAETIAVKTAVQFLFDCLQRQLPSTVLTAACKSLAKRSIDVDSLSEERLAVFISFLYSNDYHLAKSASHALRAFARNEVLRGNIYASLSRIIQRRDPLTRLNVRKLPLLAERSSKWVDSWYPVQGRRKTRSSGVQWWNCNDATPLTAAENAILRELSALVDDQLASALKQKTDAERQENAVLEWFQRYLRSAKVPFTRREMEELDISDATLSTVTQWELANADERATAKRRILEWAFAEHFDSSLAVGCAVEAVADLAITQRDETTLKYIRQLILSGTRTHYIPSDVRMLGRFLSTRSSASIDRIRDLFSETLRLDLARYRLSKNTGKSGLRAEGSLRQRITRELNDVLFGDAASVDKIRQCLDDPCIEQSSGVRWLLENQLAHPEFRPVWRHAVRMAIDSTCFREFVPVAADNQLSAVGIRAIGELWPSDPDVFAGVLASLSAAEGHVSVAAVEALRKGYEAAQTRGTLGSSNQVRAFLVAVSAAFSAPEPVLRLTACQEFRGLIWEPCWLSIATAAAQEHKSLQETEHPTPGTHFPSPNERFLQCLLSEDQVIIAAASEVPSASESSLRHCILLRNARGGLECFLNGMPSCELLGATQHCPAFLIGDVPLQRKMEVCVNGN